MAVRLPRQRRAEGVFTAGQASRLSGVSLPTLAYWAVSDFVTPSAQEAQGTGTWRGYTFRDIVQLRVAKHLRDAGLSLQKLRKAQERLQQVHGPETPFGDTYLVTNGRDVFEVKQGNAAVRSFIQQSRPPSDTWIIVDLAHTVVEVLQALDAERRRVGEREEGRGNRVSTPGW
jgi:DNA-binding transcriptional MerR regulator